MKKCSQCGINFNQKDDEEICEICVAGKKYKQPALCKICGEQYYRSPKLRSCQKQSCIDERELGKDYKIRRLKSEIEEVRLKRIRADEEFRKEWGDL